MCVCRIVGPPLWAWAEGPDTPAGFGNAILRPLLIGERQFEETPRTLSGADRQVRTPDADAAAVYSRPHTAQKWRQVFGRNRPGGTYRETWWRDRLSGKRGAVREYIHPDDLPPEGGPKPTRDAGYRISLRCPELPRPIPDDVLPV